MAYPLISIRAVSCPLQKKAYKKGGKLVEKRNKRQKIEQEVLALIKRLQFHKFVNLYSFLCFIDNVLTCFYMLKIFLIECGNIQKDFFNIYFFIYLLIIESNNWNKYMYRNHMIVSRS